MELDSIYQSFQVDKSAAIGLAYYPYYNSFDTALKDRILVNGREMINLASHNYLGLAYREEVLAAMEQSLRHYGASLCGTPIATGYSKEMKETEKRLSEWLGVDDTLLFPSCYQANASLFNTVCGEKDLILVDHFAHASLIQGIRSSKAKIKPFLHNNIKHLESLLCKASTYDKVFVVTESVFSTEGSIAPFRELYDIALRYCAVPVIDDSHGIGVIGESGKGILEHAGITDYQGIYTASLGKSLAQIGGMISGNGALIDYMRYYCAGYVYSTAIPPYVLAGLNRGLDIINSEFPILSGRMWGYKRRIYKALIDSGYGVCEGEAPITSVMTKGFEATIRLASAFFERGLATTPFVPPSVPPEGGRVRLIAGANLSDETISKAIGIIEDFGRKTL